MGALLPFGPAVGLVHPRLCQDAPTGARCPLRVTVIEAAGVGVIHQHGEVRVVVDRGTPL